MLQSKHLMYYLYQLQNPQTKQPFYIGVAKENRRASCTREQQHIKEAVAWSKGRKIQNANKLKFNTILKIMKTDKIIIEKGPYFVNEQDAFLLETKLIKKYGRRDLGTGVLTNLTDGGEGAVNMSKETKNKIGNWFKGKPSPLKGRKLGPYSEARRKAISEARKGYKTPEEVKQKLKSRIPWNKGMKFEYKERPNAKGRTTKNQWTKGHTPWNKGIKAGSFTTGCKGKTWRLEAGRRVWYSK